MECSNFVDLILEEKWVGLDGDAWLALMETTGRKVGRTGRKGARTMFGELLDELFFDFSFLY